jgi:hypothetical protein
MRVGIIVGIVKELFVTSDRILLDVKIEDEIFLSMLLE